MFFGNMVGAMFVFLNFAFFELFVLLLIEHQYLFIDLKLLFFSLASLYQKQNFHF